MTLPPQSEPTLRRRWLPVVLAFIVTAAELSVHCFTLGRVAAWQPGYPAVVVYGLFTPPAAIRAVHKLGPSLLILAFIATALAELGPMRRNHSRRPLLFVGGGTIALLLVLYAWALLWVVRVWRYAG